MKPALDATVRTFLQSKLEELEKEINSDMLCYYGPILDGNENVLLNIVEDLANDPNKKVFLK